MTSTPSEADVQRVEHAKRVLAEASGDMLTADWGTLYWIAQQVPPLLDVIDHLATLSPPVGVLGSEVHGYDNGIPVRTLHIQEKACGCGVLVGEGCDCYDTGWSQ